MGELFKESKIIQGKKKKFSCSKRSPLWPHELYNQWNSPGQITGVGSPSLLQEIFQTQGLNPGLPHCKWIPYQLNHQGSPRTLEWVAYPFSRGSSRPRNRIRVFCIAGRFFTSWDTREAPFYTVVYSQLHRNTTPSRGCVQLTVYTRHMS